MSRFPDPIICPKSRLGPIFVEKSVGSDFLLGTIRSKLRFGDRVSPSLYVFISIGVVIRFMLCRERLKLIPRLQEKGRDRGKRWKRIVTGID